MKKVIYGIIVFLAYFTFCFFVIMLIGVVLSDVSKIPLNIGFYGSLTVAIILSIFLSKRALKIYSEAGVDKRTLYRKRIINQFILSVIVGIIVLFILWKKIHPLAWVMYFFLSFGFVYLGGSISRHINKLIESYKKSKGKI